MGMGVIGKGGSWLPCLALLLLVIYPTITHARSKKVDVYVAGFFPVGKGLKSSLGRGVMPALKLAIKHVNDHPTVLRNYKLHVVWNDTQCNTAVGTKSFFDMMDRLPRKVMLFGAACTHVTDPIAKAAKHWHIVQLSYADTHPMFSASKYPNFFRMVPSDKDFNMPRIHLLQKFNWTRVGTLFQNEPRHALAHNHLASLLDLYKFEIAETQSFADEFKDQMKKLLDKDVRIILGYFDEMWARRIFCEAFRKGMYGANYQWIISGMYREEWWTLRGNGDDDDDEGVIDMKDEPEESGGGGCAVEDIMVALEGCIMTDLLPLATSQTKTVSGKNISEYRKAYNQKRQDEYSRFHGFTYDGVWAMALAIQAVGHKLHLQNRLNGTNTSVVDFMYRSPEWEERFTSALSEVKFDGVTGPVQFTMDNARKGYILLKQFQGGREVKIGEFDGIEDVLLLDKGHPIYWPGGDPPLDRTVKSIEKTSVNISIYAILVTTASLGIVMASIFLAINIKYRHQRYIKMSSPYLNNLIIVGCILTYTSVILLGLDSELTSEATFPYICTARAWVLMWGFSLAFGSMFSKTWRVHSIFTDVQLNKKVIKDSQLFLVVFVLLCVDVAIMTTWQIVDPFYRETKLLTAYMRDDILVIPENEYCKSSKISVFIGCIYAYKGLLMVFGCFLAWETRHVSIPALNDSKYIGFSVYNVVIMCVISAPISYVLSDKQDVCYLIISIFIIFCTTGTLCLVFVPKIIELRRNPQGTMERPKIRPSMKPPKSADSDSDVSDLHEQIKKAESDRQVFIRTLREREQELQMLIEQLGDEALAEVEGQDSRVGRRPSKPRSIERIRIEGGPRTGPSVTETTEATELTSLCSGTSQDAEYVPGRMRVPCVSSSLSTTTTTTSTTTTHHHHLHYHHLPASGVATATLSLDRSARRGVTFASPLQTPREASKSVSFRLEGGGAGPGGIVTSTAPVGPGGGGGVGGGLIGHTATVETVPQSHMNTQPPLPQESSRGRVASQESLGTMSSRGSVSGSIYSVTSARSDAAVSRCSSKETVRNHAPLIQQNRSSGHHHSYHMNGEMMSETTASSDDLAHPQNTLVYREQTSLHRTISEPYYNFDDDESESAGQQHLQMLQQHVQQQQQLLQQQQQQFRSGRARLPPVRTPSYDNSYDTSSLGEFSTQSLRGRSHSIGRPSRGATTTSVAAAIAAARKNASDNALDHDTSILPIFQKLLRERHQGYHGGRDFTMSSCPNITIKCDIVEYL
ncbi:gamma-aminobutyric acid type B receptor subunit 2 isoform X10 [Macrobrachium rosenbergii]|uniref:gamma-aminobutyric acid type B receptor subunit 2 isoform X10 n=1 Tax=Macrobrachium rosenbergii TaxID=79674 RepID=UPI0034D5F8C2